MNKLYFCEVSDLPYSIKYMKGYILEKLEKAVFPNNRERISKHDQQMNTFLFFLRLVFLASFREIKSEGK